MLFVGHSHIVAALLAARDRGVRFDALVFRELKLKELGLDGPTVRTELPNKLTPEAVELLQAHRGPIYSFLGKRDHTEFALIEHPQPFDIVLPEDTEETLDPRAEVVSAASVRDTLRLLAKQSLGLARRLQRLPRSRLVHFESPPPASPEWLAEVAGWDAIAACRLRLKAWRLHAAVMKQGIESVGGVYVPAPREAFDGRGFLRDELCRNATHANARYGSLVLDQIGRLA